MFSTSSCSYHKSRTIVFEKYCQYVYIRHISLCQLYDIPPIPAERLMQEHCMCFKVVAATDALIQRKQAETNNYCHGTDTKHGIRQKGKCHTRGHMVQTKEELHRTSCLSLMRQI